jgi:ATP-binding cassette, subfamily F, member 3
LIQFKSLTLTRGVKVLVEEASFQLHPGHKVGLTGANGAGKSSIFAMLRGDLHPEHGELEMPPNWVIAHVAQETPALSQEAIEFTLDGDVELRTIEAALVEAEAKHEGEKIGELHARFSEIGGYSARARAAELLDGLGFKNVDLKRLVSDFSGGWRVRLNLARALMCRSDLLLLDEPTNHLDLDAVIWLETWLKDYRGTLVLISHDRDFLDAIVNHIAHIEQKRLTLYKGGYSDFERQRAERLAQQQSMYERQQRNVAHLQSYIERFRAKATKARQAQSRIKALERMEMISAAHTDTPFDFSFREMQNLPDPLLVLDDVSVGYGDAMILSKLELALRPGERLGLLGRNGTGKSTLIKLLANELSMKFGKRVEGKDLKVGYFAQHQLEQLRLDESPLEHMQKLDPETREQEHRNYLGGFDFKGDMASSPCGPFSGGEKSRLALALLIWTRPNLLLLDEPTNHLDLEMRHALTVALQDYQGGVVIVSHDRAMLRATCDRFMLVDHGGAEVFDGDLDDYKDWLNSQRLTDKQNLELNKEAPTSSNKLERAQSKADRQARIAERRPLLKETEHVEVNMAKLAQDKSNLDNKLADPNLYIHSDKKVLQDLLKQQAVLKQELENLEMRWLELQEMLESLPVIQ